MVQTVTTWDDPRIGYGSIQIQVQNAYNDFRQQTHSYQEHIGGVNTSTTPKVQYSYTNGTGNTIRMTGMTYPSGRGLTYAYGTANAINDACSRIESVINTSDSVNLATYQYLGASGFVNAASGQPGISWTLIGTGNDPATGDIYWGLDRFGRVDNCLWKKSTTTLAQIQYGYDRASNRTWRKDGVLTGYDELYSYDGLYRLNDQKRGTLNGTQTAITSGTFEQQWGLDPTGNWKAFKQDNDGNGTWELNQTRVANKANEITDITNTTGPVWAKPSYDTAGNMVGIPNAGTTVTGSNPAWVPLTEAQWNTLTEAQWSALTENTGTTPQQLSASYDAWNRLVLISNGTQKISENVYDARGYRIRKDAYTSGTLTESRHYYYTPGWQCVEERVGTSTTAERQFVWGLRYIDDLVLRDRSTANNGTMNERRYAMQDGNWNTIAICDITGFVSERFAYSAYGTPVFMTGAGVVQSASTVGFETLYAGYRWDGISPQMYYVRNRFLLPTIGTWNRRDPLGYVDGMSLYRAYFVVGAVDPSGLLTMRVRKHRLLGKCGGFIHIIDWKPDKDEKKGFIVQKICFKDKTKPCKDGDTINCTAIPNIRPPLNQKSCDDGCYIEGWYVDGNWIGTHDKKDGGQAAKTDTFAKPNCPKTYGEYSIVGEALFIPFDWTVQNPEWDVRKLVNQGMAGVITAHSLFSACWSDPGVKDFWNKVIGVFGASSTKRSSSTAWSCCGSYDCHTYRSEFDDNPIVTGDS